MKDKSVLFTGAGRGIGKRLAMGFAEAGAGWGCCRAARPNSIWRSWKSKMPAASPRIRADVCELEQMRPRPTAMRAVFGGIDILIAAAGVQGPDRSFAHHQAQGVERDHRYQPGRRGEFVPRGSAVDDRAPFRQDHPDRGRRIEQLASEFQRVCRVEGRPGAGGGMPGRRGSRPQRAGQLHFPGRRVHAYDG